MPPRSSQKFVPDGRCRLFGLRAARGSSRAILAAAGGGSDGLDLEF